MDLNNTFLDHFEPLNDPRLENGNSRHNFHDILVITILGSICSVDNWVELCAFGQSNIEWLSTFLELPNGIPSHDTFGRVFSLIDPEKFEECFSAWVTSLVVTTEGRIIPVDGKTLRGSGNKTSGQKPLHLVSAWASEQRIMLGQVATEEKSNEITAIPELLKMIDISGSTVTIDAMGCQKDIAKLIVKKEADYVLSLKGNQPTLFKDVKNIFDLGESRQFKKMLNRRKVDKTRDHGRIEKRRYTLISARDNLEFELRWPGLKSIGMVEITRTVNNETEYSKRFFVSSLSYENIDTFQRAVRKHWQIEIDLHWSLDVAFREDLNQVRIGHAARNLATVRRIALNLLKQDINHKGGIACRRKRAGWDRNYLMKIIGFGTNPKQE